MRILFLLLILNPFAAMAQEQTLKQELMNLSKIVKAAEQQSEAIESALQKLRDQEEELFETVMGYRYETAKAYHSLKVLEQSPQSSIFLIPDRKYSQHIYEMRKTQTIRDILMSRMTLQTNTLLKLQDKQNSIKEYIKRRESLALALDTSLQQLDKLSRSRQPSKDIQKTLIDLKDEAKSLDAFMYSLLNIPVPEISYYEPLAFTLPVSGVITSDSTGIYIKAAPRSLITSPERGIVAFAGDFNPLGKIIIINHGEGYISILRNIETFFVQEGLTVQKNEPIGTLSDKSRDNSGNSTMLYYELRYNNSIINPIDKITGL